MKKLLFTMLALTVSGCADTYPDDNYAVRDHYSGAPIYHDGHAVTHDYYGNPVAGGHTECHYYNDAGRDYYYDEDGLKVYIK